MQDSYTKGQVSIVELLDAQKANVQAQQAASSALYDYLKSILEVERSIGFSRHLRSEGEALRFERSFLEYVQKIKEANE